MRAVGAPWRSEGQERAFAHFETEPGEQAQMDWGHFGNWGGKRLYGFALTLCWSRMRYVEFTQRQDAETILNCMVHAFASFEGVTRTVLTDNMKTVVVDRIGGQPRFHPKMLDFPATTVSVRGSAVRTGRRPRGKIESMIRFIKGPGIAFDSLQELNRRALVWCHEVNRQAHSKTREIPQTRFAHEGLTPLNGQPAYDTSYVSHRQVAKDCLFSYRGNRYSVPHVHAGRSVLVREPLDSGVIRVFSQKDLIAEHKTVAGKGVMVVEPSHYGELPRRCRTAAVKLPLTTVELSPGPGVGLHYIVPEVEFRPLSTYNVLCEEVAYVTSV